MWDGYHHMWGMHWGWWIFWIILIVSAVWMFTRNRTRGPVRTESRETAIDVLERRYANGEISTEEYEERRNRLERP